MRELETSVRQLEARCNDLRDAASGHDQRAKEAQAEVLKGNHIIEKLMVRLQWVIAKRRIYSNNQVHCLIACFWDHVFHTNPLPMTQSERHQAG